MILAPLSRQRARLTLPAASTSVPSCDTSTLSTCPALLSLWSLRSSLTLTSLVAFALPAPTIPRQPRRAPWDDSAAATAAAAATARLPGAIPKAIAKKRAEFEAEQAEKARNAALGVRSC